MALTQEDVARRAQVSRSLVSKVLFGETGVRVSEDKRKQIVRLAKELGYRPNSAATNLRRGRAHAVVSLSQYDPVDYTSVTEVGTMEMMAVELAQIGLELKLRPYATREQVIAGIDEIVSSSMCDAVVLWLDDEGNEEAGQALEKHGIPFVVVGSCDDRYPGWLQVDFDHAVMMRASVEHVLSRGRRRIAYIGHDTELDYAKRLQDGFASAVKELSGVSARPEWLYKTGPEASDTQIFVERWMEMPAELRPDGVVIGAGNCAWEGVEKSLALRGLRIGLGNDDLVVTGQRFKNVPLVFGHAMAFDNVQMTRVSRLVIDLIQKKLAGQEIDNNIVRIKPVLVPASSMEMPLPPRL